MAWSENQDEKDESDLTERRYSLRELIIALINKRRSDSRYDLYKYSCAM